MNNSNVDYSEVLNLFNQLEGEKRDKILFKALKSGAEVLKRNTQINLNTALGTATTQQLDNGVRIASDKKDNQVKVHIMGDYRLKWFEKGTKQRLTKAGASRGSIKPMNFFRNARQAEGEINNAVIQSIDEQLKSIK